MDIREVLQHVVRQMCWRRVALRIVVGLLDVLELVVVVVLELMLVRLHLLLFVGLQGRLKLLLEVLFRLRLPLPVPPVLLCHRVLRLSLLLGGGGGYHRGKALGQLGRKLELICAHRGTGALLLRR